MTVYYIDELGECAVDIDFDSIVFFNGEAWFTSGNEEFRIKVENLIEIVKHN